MRWIGFANMALIGMILLTGALFLFSEPDESFLTITPRPIQKELPRSPFAESEDFFLGIDEGIFALHWVPPQMQLPDLSRDLIFYGKNARPDAQGDKAGFHISIKESGERALIQEGDRVYLVYQGNYTPKTIKPLRPNAEPSGSGPIWGEESIHLDQTSSKGFYAFSPGNQPTPLWLELKKMGEQSVEVRVSMLDEKGMFVTTPNAWRSFHLTAQEFPKTQMLCWDLGGLRVDTTLLVRQKARWVGSDLFLQMHGGDDYAFIVGKERIDLFEGTEPYSCFVAEGESLVWNGTRWQSSDTVENSQKFPLLVVKKIDEKIMTFELWDTEGRAKHILNLVRSKDHTCQPSMAYEMKFVGAKTWAQFIVESRSGERMTLKLHDWLVLTPQGWTKLDTPEKIDAYVGHRLNGPLFVLDKIAKQNGRQVLIGHLFNVSRTEVEQVELASSPTTSIAHLYRHMPVAPPMLPKSSEVTLEGRDE